MIPSWLPASQQNVTVTAGGATVTKTSGVDSVLNACARTVEGYAGGAGSFSVNVDVADQINFGFALGSTPAELLTLANWGWYASIGFGGASARFAGAYKGDILTVADIGRHTITTEIVSIGGGQFKARWLYDGVLKFTAQDPLIFPFYVVLGILTINASVQTIDVVNAAPLVLGPPGSQNWMLLS